MTPPRPAEIRHYAIGSIILHWAIAVLIIGNIVLGVVGRDAHPPAKFAILGLHKSIGLTILMLSLLRLGWRLTHRPPALPATMRRWERGLAHIVHACLYIVMIGMPLTGWISVTAYLSAPPIRYFGMVTWPGFPLVRDLAPGTLGPIHSGFALTHSVLGKMALALLVLHVAGALKHMLVRDGIMWRMAPVRLFLPRRSGRTDEATAEI